MDTFCYERQHGADMEVGSYAHRAILHEPEEIPSIEQAKLSPTEMPFTSDDFDPQLEQAYELMPELLGAEGAEIRYAINGLLSLTCDGNPILGESPVSGLWTAAAVWIKEGPGVGRAVAEWMTDGHSEIDVAPQRHRPLLPAPDAPRAHPAAHHRVVHQDLRHRAPRPSSTSPTATSGSRRCTTPQAKLGARFFEAVGWERPQWYESNAGLLEEYGDAVMPRENEWDSRWWSPIINAEHLRMREAAGVIDLTAFAIFDITGPGALAAVQRDLRRRSATSRSARSIYTPVLDAKRRLPLRPDRDAARRGPLPGGHRRRARHGRPEVVRRPAADGRLGAADDLTDEISTIGLWGPRARDILASLTDDDISDDGLRLPAPAARSRSGGDRTVLASRISYVGELGWELYVPMEHGAALWDGAARGRCAARRGARRDRRLRARPGGSRRATARSATSSTASARSSRPACSGRRSRPADFVGKQAYLAQRDAGAGDGAVHADRRRPHVRQRHEALHARR